MAKKGEGITHDEKKRAFDTNYRRVTFSCLKEKQGIIGKTLDTLETPYHVAVLGKFSK